MTDKELRSLKRAELIEILYYLSRENDELKEQISTLRADNNRLVDCLTAAAQGRLEAAPSEAVPSSGDQTEAADSTDEEPDNRSSDRPDE